MTQLTAAESAWIDQEDRHTADDIRRFGIHIAFILGDPARRTPSFAYSIGLFGLAHPELLVLGADHHTAGHLLNAAAERVRAGTSLVAGEVLEFEGWRHRVTVEAVPNPGEIAFAANRYYQRPDEASVPLLQLTYDDLEGRFPWDSGYSTPEWIQPRPGDFRA